MDFEVFSIIKISRKHSMIALTTKSRPIPHIADCQNLIIEASQKSCISLCIAEYNRVPSGSR